MSTKAGHHRLTIWIPDAQYTFLKSSFDKGDASGVYGALTDQIIHHISNHGHVAITNIANKHIGLGYDNTGYMYEPNQSTPRTNIHMDPHGDS